MKLGLVVVLSLLGLAVDQAEQISLRKMGGLSPRALAPAPSSHSNLGARLGDIWEDCGKSGDKAKIEDVVFKPNPPVQGMETISANFTLYEEVSGGTLAANISIDGQNIVNQDLDLCGQVAPAIGLQCNLTKGLQMASFSVDLSGVPSGHITGTQHLKDQDGNQLFCVKLDLKL